MQEREVLYAVLKYLGTYPGVMVWRNNVGVAKDRTGQAIRFGVPGSADVLGILAPHGRMIGVECKSAVGRLRPDQIRWRDAFESRGGLYILARRVEDIYPWFPPTA